MPRWLAVSVLVAFGAFVVLAAPVAYALDTGDWKPVILMPFLVALLFLVAWAAASLERR